MAQRSVGTAGAVVEEKRMNHLQRISRPPAKAQDICNNIQSDYQAMMCFLINLLTAFFLPLAQLKSPNDGEAA